MLCVVRARGLEGVEDGVLVVSPDRLVSVGGLLVGERQPLVGVVAAGFTVGSEGEVAAAKAAGGGGVDRRNQLPGEDGVAVCPSWEEVQNIGGDGEADQTWDRGRKEHDRALRGVLDDG